MVLKLGKLNYFERVEQNMKYVKWCFIKLPSRDGFIPNEVFY